MCRQGILACIFLNYQLHHYHYQLSCFVTYFIVITISIVFVIILAVTMLLFLQFGLYSAFFGSYLYVVFGTIKEVSIGPTAVMSLLTHEFVHGLAVEYVVLLTFLSGCVELIMGLLNLGK